MRRESKAPTPAPISAIQCGVQLLPHGLALAGFMCSLFTVTASLALAVTIPLSGIDEPRLFYFKLWARTAGFAFICLGAGLWLRRLMRAFPPRLNAPPLASEAAGGRALLAATVCFLAALLLPRLSQYPWTAPDELHHLTVARNLAESGQYASGHPSGQLVAFDPYDSVGPAVIVPVAASIALFDEPLIAARAIMAGMFVLWTLLTWLLVRPLTGGGPAALGVLLAGTAIGSIYLGRTLYGEVPALMYATAGLLYWRMALGRARHQMWSVLAGICFGLCVLSKAILVLTVFPITAAYLFDRLAFRRIPLSRLLWPAIAAAATILSWALVQMGAGGAGESSEVMFHLYRHYLLFGFTSVETTLGWLANHWAAVLVAALGFVAMLPALLLVRYDPPTLVLGLTGVLFGYWWVFFTPGQIPRYLWFTLAIGCLFAGPLAYTSIRSLSVRSHGVRARVVAGFVILLLAFPAFVEVQRVVSRTWFDEQMADEYALQDFIRSHAEQPIVTTSWMAQRSANFFANRYLPRIEPSQIGNTAAIVVRDRALEPLENTDLPAIGSGRYVLDNFSRPSPVEPQ